MKNLLRTALAGSVVIGSMVVGIGDAQAGSSCHSIAATGVGYATGPTTTVADIADGGLLNGTTVGSFTPDFTNFPPLVGLEGTVVFTVNKASLTVAITGSLDVTTGAFTAAGPVSASTGKLAGATGSLTFDGVQDLASPTGDFTETVTGTICVAVSK